MSEYEKARARVEKYMECAGSVKHQAAAYRDTDGKIHLLEFSDLRVLLDHTNGSE
jgi:hypothetical protein